MPCSKEEFLWNVHFHPWSGSFLPSPGCSRHIRWFTPLRGIRIPDINCSYLTSAVGVVYSTSQKLAIRKEILQAVSEQYGVSVSAVDSGIRRMIDQLEAKPAEGWTQFKAESGFEAEKPTTGKLIYAIKRYLIQQKSRE